MLLLGQLKEQYNEIQKSIEKNNSINNSIKLNFHINQLNNLQAIILSQNLDTQKGFSQLYDNIDKQIKKINIKLTKIRVAEYKELRGRYQKYALQNIKEFKELYTYSKNLENVNLFIKNAGKEKYIPRIFDDFPKARIYLDEYILKQPESA